MRVTIERKTEDIGITSTGLGKTEFYNLHRVGEEPLPIPVDFLLTDTATFRRPDERTANLDIREALQQLKQHIEYHATPRKASDTFEL